mgnify:FL=1
MIKIGSIVRDTYNNKIGILTQIHNSKTGRGVLGYTIFVDGAYQPVSVGWLEVIYGW